MCYNRDPKVSFVPGNFRKALYSLDTFQASARGGDGQSGRGQEAVLELPRARTPGFLQTVDVVGCSGRGVSLAQQITRDAGEAHIALMISHAVVDAIRTRVCWMRLAIRAVLLLLVLNGQVHTAAWADWGACGSDVLPQRQE